MGWFGSGAWGADGTHGWQRALATVGGPWTPFALGSALSVLLDAQVTASLTVASGTVSAWQNQATAGNTYTQGTAAAQPAYAATSFNNLPGLTFDGVGTVLIGSAPFVPGTAYSAIVMGTIDSSGPTNNARLLSLGGTGGGSGVQDYDAQASIVVARNGSNQQVLFYHGGKLLQPSLPAYLTPFSAFTALDGPNKVLSAAINGGAATTVALSTTDTLQYVNLIIGSGYYRQSGATNSGAVNGYHKGVISFACFSSTVLSAGDTDKLTGYANWRYGTQGNLPAVHPYKAAAPTLSAHDVERMWDEGQVLPDARYRRSLARSSFARRRSGLIVPERMAA